MKNILFPLGLVVVFLGVILVFAVTRNGDQELNNENEEALEVVATFYPLAFVAERIGGSAVEVSNLTAGGQEPHDFEPTAGDIIAMQNADLLLTLGDIDAWTEGVVADRRADTKSALVIEETIEFEEHDPHIWLDPAMMKTVVSEVQIALTEQLPESASDFQRNAVILLADLDMLDDDYSSLQTCQRDDIIVAHDAFGYLASRYGFSTHAVSGLSPEEEPSARDLANLANLAEQLQVATIFFESTAGSAIAETLADEAETETAVLTTLESLTSEEVAAGDDYFTLMRRNLAALQAELCR